MIRTLQNRYVVVTGDLKSSRRLEDRAEVQEELKNALRMVNRRFEEEIAAKKNFGVGERSVYKTLRTGKYHLWRDAENAVADLLNQKWLMGAGDKSGLHL